MNAPAPPASVDPPFKWVGGKRELAPGILPYVTPEDGRCYYEPMVGGGALFLAGNPRRAVLADVNPRVVATYRALRHDLPDVLGRLRRHAERHAEDPAGYFYETRSAPPSGDNATAAWLIYFLRACFNGLMRVNRAGEVNTPKGDCDDFAALSAPRSLPAVAARLQNAELREGCFSDTSVDAEAGDAVYFDPPYLRRGGFTAYAGAFGLDEHRRLEAHAWKLAQRGVHVAVSNDLNAQVLAAYPPSRWRPLPIMARRAVNRSGSGRGPVAEVVLVPVTSGAHDQRRRYRPEPLTCLCGCGEPVRPGTEYADPPGGSTHRVRAMRARRRAEAGGKPLPPIAARWARRRALEAADDAVDRAGALEQQAAALAAEAAALRATAAELRRDR